MENLFQLHPRLQADTFFVSDLTLSRLLLMNDKRFPWLILVPKRNGIKELYQLKRLEQNQLLLEITEISKWLQTKFSADKINIGALGNQVPQLHIHIIARKLSDPAWPNPVWGFEKPTPYAENAVLELVETLKSSIPTIEGF